jgi:hypothetical protein
MSVLVTAREWFGFLAKQEENRVPILSGALESLVISIVTIAYGLRWERYYTAWISVVMNVIFTAIVWGSTDLPMAVIYVLAVYIALGVASAWKNIRTLFPLFGTKTFGALSLTITLSQWWTLSRTNPIINYLGLGLDVMAQEYLVSWFVIAAILHVIGFVFFRNHRELEGIF